MYQDGVGVVDERRAAAPAVRVGVLVGLGLEHAAAAAQVGDEVVGDLAHAAPGVGPGAVVEGAVGAHRVDHGQALLAAEAEVVLAERDRGVHEARAVLGRDEVGRDHGVALGAVGLGGNERERRLVARAEQLGAGEQVEHLGVLTQQRLHAGLGQHHDAPGVRIAGAHVAQVRVGGDGGVRDQRPRRGRPGQQLVAGLQRRARFDHREAHVQRRVDDVEVAAGQAELVAGQRRAAARAVGHDLVALVEQALVPQRLQRPPHRLHVVRVHGPVGVVEVDPERDPLGQAVPVRDVGHGRLAAAGVEGLDAVALDVGLAGRADLLLDLQLHRQAVAVVAALALDVVAAHGLVAREDVLEHARQHVVRAGRAVDRGRALVEDEAVGALAAAQRLAEDVALAPALEDGLFEARERGAGIDRTVRRQGLRG